MEFGELVGCAWMLQQLAFWHAGGHGALGCSVEIGGWWKGLCGATISISSWQEQLPGPGYRLRLKICNCSNWSKIAMCFPSQIKTGS